eukprot:92165_1
MGNGIKARFSGDIVADIRVHCKSTTLKNPQENITKITTRSCRLLDGSYSWLATGLKAVVTLDFGGDVDAIEHWWMIIQTASRYFMVHFRGFDPTGAIEMRECSTLRQCDENGIAEAGRNTDVEVWTQKKYSFSWPNGKKSGKTIEDVVKFLQNDCNPHYNLVVNNCQHLCRRLYNYCICYDINESYDDDDIDEKKSSYDDDDDDEDEDEDFFYEDEDEDEDAYEDEDDEYNL